MRARHPIPTRWLMTDERMDAGLWAAVERLPRGSGIVFRHYATDLATRRTMFTKLKHIAAKKGLLLVRAGAARLGRNESGVHGGRGGGLRTAAAHDRRQAIAAWRAGADVIFVSPVFATRSHSGAGALGPLRAATIGRGLDVTRIALGGMDARRFRRLRGLGFDGWAAIDAWLR
jgi:thiamine-phosphate pyrophosphorylase